MTNPDPRDNPSAGPTFTYEGRVRLGEPPDQGWLSPFLIETDGHWGGLEEPLMELGLIEFMGEAKLRIVVQRAGEHLAERLEGGEDGS